MLSENPIFESETEENHFDGDEADVLYDAYMILSDYGYTDDDLAPLRHLINETTYLNGDSLVLGAERMED